MESLGTREILTHFTSLLNGQMSCNGLSNRYSGQTTTLFKLYESSSFSSTIQSMMEGWTFIHGFEGACQYLLKAKLKSLSAKSCIHIKKKYHCSPVCKFRFITFGHHIVKRVKNPLGLLQQHVACSRPEIYIMATLILFHIKTFSSLYCESFFSSSMKSDKKCKKPAINEKSNEKQGVPCLDRWQYFYLHSYFKLKIPSFNS